MKPNDEVRSGYTALETIVYDFLSVAEKGEEEFRKVYQIALRGYREMQRDVTGPVSTIPLKVLANKTARLPLDYSNWIRVGALNDNGELATLSRNDQLTSFEACCDDRNSSPEYVIPQVTINDIYNLALNGRIPYWGAASLGIGSLNNIGEFKVDKDKGYILFNPGFNYDMVIMEYMADIAFTGNDYLVDVNIEDAIIAYIIWWYNWLRKDVSSIDKRMFKAEFYNQKRLAKSRMNPLRAQDISDSYKKFVKSAPRN